MIETNHKFMRENGELFEIDGSLFKCVHTGASHARCNICDLVEMKGISCFDFACTPSERNDFKFCTFILVDSEDSEEE